MKLSIQREAFLKPLQQIIGVVERRQTLPILGNVLLNVSRKSIRLTATDLEVELQAEVAAPVTEVGDITLPARKLLDICRTLPEEAMLDISVKDERALLRSGHTYVELTLPIADLEAITRIRGEIDGADAPLEGAVPPFAVAGEFFEIFNRNVNPVHD